MEKRLSDLEKKFRELKKQVSAMAILLKEHEDKISKKEIRHIGFEIHTRLESPKEDEYLPDEV